MISGFEKLDVWRLSHELALRLYNLTRKFPPEERFGVTAQIRRAALAIPTNLAEGNARQYWREYLQFCGVARGSTAEVRYLRRFVYDMGLISHPEFESLTHEYGRVGQMLNALMATLRGHARRPRK